MEKKVTTKFLWRDELRKLGYRTLPSSALQEIRTDFQVILEVCLRELEYLYLLAFVWDFLIQSENFRDKKVIRCILFFFSDRNCSLS